MAYGLIRIQSNVKIIEGTRGTHESRSRQRELSGVVRRVRGARTPRGMNRDGLGGGGFEIGEEVHRGSSDVVSRKSE